MTTSPDRPEFVCTTYIRTTPERLFAALTEPAFTRRYWDIEFDTDWRLGSTMTWVRDGLRNAHPEQLVLECDPPRRLSYTWHTFTPEWAEAVGIDEDLRARIASEPRSRATFELEPEGPLVKLTVIHDGFEPGSEVVKMVSTGWPRVMGSLKTLLETGDVDDAYATSAVTEAPARAVFDALTTLDGLGAWWIPDVTGAPASVGGEVTFHWDAEHVTMRVEHLDPTLVVWTCTEASTVPEWVGNTLWFDLRERDASHTLVDFRQVGLFPTCDCYGECSSGWDHAVSSLASYAGGEGGHPRGSAKWQAMRGVTV